jgi:hypothetical protein
LAICDLVKAQNPRLIATTNPPAIKKRSFTL